MNVNSLKKFLSDLPCKCCLSINTEITLTNQFGYAQKVSVHCLSCDETYSFDTSEKVNKTKANNRPAYDVNRRIIKTFLSLGKGHMGMETFSMGMDMPCMTHTTFDTHVIKIVDITKEHVQESLKKARVEVEKAYSEIENTLNLKKPLDIAVSYDGSWQKRGFTSKYGVGCVIEVITGLVIDYDVLSKYCRVCEYRKTKVNEDSEQYEEWYETHRSTCQANFEGSSGAMEVEAAERIWKRSESLGFRYTSIISDGDSKTHDHLSSLDVYGKDVPIEKHECVNHVAKRLGTGLRNLVKKCSAQKITLGGKSQGSLKISTIDKLTKYYRNAVINNLNDIKEMKNAIFATIDHCRSTDAVPRHQKCPRGKDSWCFFQRDLANNAIPRKHSESIKTPLNENVVKHIIPLYTRLSTEDLLKRCSQGKTQNANEALHGLIWSKCPKTTFTAKRRVEAAVGEAIAVYNEGYLITVTKLMSRSGVSPGTKTEKLAGAKDAKRLLLRKARSTEQYKKYRKILKESKLKEEEQKKAKEGKTYGAGEF